MNGPMFGGYAGGNPANGEVDPNMAAVKTVSFALEPRTTKVQWQSYAPQQENAILTAA